MAYNKKYADWGRKIWYEIIAPKEIFNETTLGETPAYKPEQVVGRSVNLNLAFITGNFRFQNYKAIFVIKSVSGTRAYTELKEIGLYDIVVRKLVRRGTSRVDDSFVVETKDGIKIRVKPLIITRGRARRRQKSAIREAFKEFMIEESKDKTFYELVSSIINRELQNKIKPQLNKIFPIQSIEIRRFVRETPILEKEKVVLVE